MAAVPTAPGFRVFAEDAVAALATDMECSIPPGRPVGIRESARDLRLSNEG